MVIAGVATVISGGVGVEFRHHIQASLPIVQSQAITILEPDETGKTIRDGAVTVILETRLGPRGTSLEFAILAGAGARDFRSGRIVTPRLAGPGYRNDRLIHRSKAATANYTHKGVGRYGEEPNASSGWGNKNGPDVRPSFSRGGRPVPATVGPLQDPSGQLGLTVLDETHQLVHIR